MICQNKQNSKFFILKVLKPWLWVNEAHRAKVWAFSNHKRKQLFWWHFFTTFDLLWINIFFLLGCKRRLQKEEYVMGNYGWVKQQPAVEMLAAGRRQLPCKINSHFAQAKNHLWKLYPVCKLCGCSHIHIKLSKQETCLQMPNHPTVTLPVYK